MTSTSTVSRLTLAACLALGAAAPALPGHPGLAAQTRATKDAPRPAPDRPAGGRAAWPDEGPRTWAPRPTRPEITADDLRTRLYQFADDSMLGRRAGELGNFKGTEYVAREFARLGLKPAGDDGTYFQVLPFGPGRYDSTAARLLIAGAPLTQRTEWIPAVPTPSNGYSGQADLSNVPTVFAGRWADTTATVDPALVRGKVAVFLAAQPSGAARPRGAAPVLPRCDSVPNRFGAAAAIAHEIAQRAAAASRIRRGPAPAVATARDVRAIDAGAAGVLVIGLDSLARTTVNAAFATRMGMQPGAAQVPGAIVSRDVGERLFGRPVDSIEVGAAGQAVSARWSYDWRPTPHAARNVLAVMPGSDPARAGEYVLVSAHNDHEGIAATAVDHDSVRAVNTVTRRQGANDPVCRPTAEQQRRIDSLIAHARSVRPPRRDSIMNGADDDGSGTVVLLELAERFATERPARSILFVSHQGEELGLLGSRWFTEHPTVPLAQIVAAHNMDMVGKGRVEQVKFGGPNSLQLLGARRLAREFGDVIDSVNAIRAEPMALDKSWDVTANPLNRFCRSDQVNYVTKDVPVTYFSLGYAQDYHMVTDEPQYIDYDHAARVGRFLHDVMLALADRKDRPAITGPDQPYPRCSR